MPGRRYYVYTMPAHARVRRWGNSLAVRIPRAVAEQSGVRDGVLVEFIPGKAKLVLRPAKPVRYRLGDLLARINEANLHGEIATGKRVGREVW